MSSSAWYEFDMAKPTNEKRMRFADEYLIDLNSTQAAIRAGYSKKSARVQGSKLLTYPDVQARIIEGGKRRAEATGINAAWLLKRLADEAEADVKDLFDEEGKLLPVKDWPLIWRQGLVGGIDVETGTTFKMDEDGEIQLGMTTTKLSKIKLSDRVKRLELIGKHVTVGAFSDKLKLEGELKITGIEVEFVKP